ncbi:helix-turn-helix transcriptional regulator [Actinospica durhamensis]|uniref:Helix-turn-helix transcriptional regulator n=1 Tax=Actinospica durhamensis TaxID=1508375 RepID=A0A941ERL1_9ACTN|nr:helix-turn-helix transcriptional regulator [Actinospica durhamensis]MBR7837140.1 helix-turn-helix transcriptional regulator [Actinospica durhamensis]
MSIKHSNFALLRDRAGYGYRLRLRAALAEITGSTRPVYIGQISTTVVRLERDGLVAKTGEDAEGHVAYEITQEGTGELEGWFARPITRGERPRDELAIKLGLAGSLPGVEITPMVRGQRTHVQAELRGLTQRELRTADPQPAWSLVLEARIFQAGAGIRRLDHMEGQACRHNR